MKSKPLSRILIATSACAAILVLVPLAFVVPRCTTNDFMVLNGWVSAARVVIEIQGRPVWTGEIPGSSLRREAVDLTRSEGGMTVKVTLLKKGLSYTSGPFGYTTRFYGQVEFFLIGYDEAHHAVWQEGGSSLDDPSFWADIRRVWPKIRHGLSCLDRYWIEGRL